MICAQSRTLRVMIYSRPCDTMAPRGQRRDQHPKGSVAIDNAYRPQGFFLCIASERFTKNLLATGQARE